MKKVSIQKIAQLAGVSKTTVSFVLNGRGDEKNISQATQGKILTIAKEQNYKANYFARSLSIGKSNTIGFIIPDISNPFFGKVARQIELYAEQKGYSVMIASTGENIDKEIKIIDELENRLIDGLIIASSATNTDQVTLITNRNTPIVFFDRVYKSIPTSYVDINNYETGYALTQLMISRGHKNIALISISSDLPNIQDRISGYLDAIEENKAISNIHHIVEENALSIKDQVKKVLEEFINTQSPPSAILFLNNVLATTAIELIHKQFSQLKNNCLLASFDNVELFDFSDPKVISAVQPIDEIAFNCVDILHDTIAGKSKSEGVKLKTKIIIR